MSGHLILVHVENLQSPHGVFKLNPVLLHVENGQTPPGAFKLTPVLLHVETGQTLLWAFNLNPVLLHVETGGGLQVCPGLESGLALDQTGSYWTPTGLGWNLPVFLLNRLYTVQYTNY